MHVQIALLVKQEHAHNHFPTLQEMLCDMF